MATSIPSRPRQMASRSHFAIVASQYNEIYVNGLVENAKKELEVIAPGSRVTVVEVPGAFEIPLLVQELAIRGGFDAIIALGVIIEGKTQHASLIGTAITNSLLQISLAHHLPVIHEVLLVQNEAQAFERCVGPDLNRGVEAARVASRMVQLLTNLARR